MAKHSVVDRFTLATVLVSHGWSTSPQLYVVVLNIFISLNICIVFP